MWKNRHKSFFVVVLNGHIQKNSSIISKPGKKKCLAIACRQKKQIALCLTLSIYFSPAFARLADSRIVAKKKQKKNKQSENRKCAIWERPRAFFASRFTARMHVTIFESF